MARALGPVLVASAATLLPFTVFSTFLVPISREAGADVAVVGSLRGLGGLAALAVGAGLAPLLDRVARLRAAAVGLLVLAAGSVVGAFGRFAALVVFCLLVGAAMAVLNPALGAAAADRFDAGPVAARAATLVTATQSLTAMLAAPLVALPAALWGWRGDLVAIAVLSVVLALVFFTRPGTVVAERPRIGYLAAYRELAALRPVFAVAMLRTAAFMGYLSYLAAYYDERFQVTPGAFAVIWTLSGTSFFLGNLVSGRLLGADRVTAHRVLPVALAIALVAVVAIFFVQVFAVALVLTSVLAVTHATATACLVTLLVRRSGDSRGAALGVNGAAMSVGTFAGAALGGAGLGVAGYPGAAAVFGGLSLVALGAAALVRKTGEDVLARA
ncbi:MFS transporter [Saccharothrix obliqua]|uniref:MFS transporter n=1 Tax=Saccharothrix obliqua TaxID=2861747 RepID=UPI001C5F8C2F|nr:MFS transporter [Saccharothrix obliqua]MBW4718407.1 MFS transporter [Saccharothrix obliqua]